MPEELLMRLVDSVRSMSFTSTLQSLGTNWVLGAVLGPHSPLSGSSHRGSQSQRVGHREGRVEPRENKRRPKLLALLTRPRAIRRQGLIGNN
mgnify:CR=1 FL=1